MVISKLAQIKIVSRPQLFKVTQNLKEQNKKIIFTNGCFDILHSGHVHLLQVAKRSGDVLIVGLNMDASVRKLKGPSRPINSQNDRATILASLGSVDYVVLFHEDTSENLIEEIRPHIYVRGSDYKGKSCPEFECVKSYGGKIEFVDLVRNKSTTKIIKRISKLA
ncbi:MAG: D-glycero-beta-D-manno-heptose 1-phosphate adenylyltransferase [bacterium]|nr:D-glycero-beta-D-manno-heptose 1-phosphate adenylyltransferase [bacterium]